MTRRLINEQTLDLLRGAIRARGLVFHETTHPETDNHVSISLYRTPFAPPETSLGAIEFLFQGASSAYVQAWRRDPITRRKRCTLPVEYLADDALTDAERLETALDGVLTGEQETPEPKPVCAQTG